MVKMTDYDDLRAKYELRRRLQARKRRAAGLPQLQHSGARVVYIPSKNSVNKGNEGRRRKGIRVTLPQINLPD